MSSMASTESIQSSITTAESLFSTTTTLLPAAWAASATFRIISCCAASSFSEVLWRSMPGSETFA